MDPLFFIMHKIPQADLKDFLSNDPKQKSYFVEHIGTAFRKIGFLALKGHFLEESLQKSLYDEMKFIRDNKSDYVIAGEGHPNEKANEFIYEILKNEIENIIK